jgi:hypothetical protein
MKKRDWNTIEQEYVEGVANEKGERSYPTLEELSVKYGIPAKTVRSHSSKGHWKNKRRAFRAELEEQARIIRFERRVKEEADFQDNCLSITKGGILHLAHHLQQFLDEYAESQKRNQSNLNKDSLQLLEGVSRTLERFQKAGCVALGIPTSNTTLSGSLGYPIELSNIPTEELDRRIQELYHQLGYNSTEESGAEEALESKKTTLSKALSAILSQPAENADCEDS